MTLDQIKQRGRLAVSFIGTLPGHSYWNPETNQAEGVEADLGRLLAKELFGNEDQVEFVKASGGERIDLLYKDRVDLIPLLTITEERLKKVDFSKPYFVDEDELLVLKNGPIKKLADLKGKKIAIVEDRPFVQHVQKYFSEAEIVIVKTKTEGVEALNNHHADAFINTHVILALIKSHRKDGNTFTIIGTDNVFPATQYHIAVKKGASDVLAFINTSLSKLEANSDLNKIFKKNGWQA